VHIIDDRTIEMVSKKAGKVLQKTRYTVATDGTTETAEYTGPTGERSATGTFKRVGKPVAGMHAVSGSWKTEKFSHSENYYLTIFEDTVDGLKMNRPAGGHFEAKFDGKEYPDGDHFVVLKRISPRTIEMTFKTDQNVLSTERISVSADGRTMTWLMRTAWGLEKTVVSNKE